MCNAWFTPSALMSMSHTARNISHHLCVLYTRQELLCTGHNFLNHALTFVQKQSAPEASCLYLNYMHVLSSTITLNNDDFLTFRQIYSRRINGMDFAYFLKYMCHQHQKESQKLLKTQGNYVAVKVSFVHAMQGMTLQVIQEINAKN